MANYNTFALVNTKTKKILMITSSARKTKKAFEKGCRIEVWNSNKVAEVIYNKDLDNIEKYICAEKEFIARKQKKAEARNKKRKEKYHRKS